MPLLCELLYAFNVQYFFQQKKKLQMCPIFGLIIFP
jgi:hypothetical protein